MGVVTISRQYGAGGRRVGQSIAEALGWRFYDGELVEEAAREAGIDPNVARDLDERTPALIEEAGLALAAAAPETGWSPLPLDDRILADRVRGLMESLARAGRCVLMGRGAQAALAARPDAVHLQLVGELDDRARRVAEWQGVEIGRAREICRQADADRAAYLKRFYDVDIRTRTLYEAILNTTKLGLEGTTEIALAIVRERLRIS